MCSVLEPMVGPTIWRGTPFSTVMFLSAGFFTSASFFAEIEGEGAGLKVRA